MPESVNQTPLTDAAQDYDGLLGSDVMVVRADVAREFERHLRSILDAPRGTRAFEAAMAKARRTIELWDLGHKP